MLDHLMACDTAFKGPHSCDLSAPFRLHPQPLA